MRSWRGAPREWQRVEPPAAIEHREPAEILVAAGHEDEGAFARNRVFAVEKSLLDPNAAPHRHRHT
jgi:hypothetical protein